MKFDLIFNSQNTIRSFGKNISILVYSLFLTLSFIELANCRSNLFRESFRSPELLRTWHSSSGINIFCTGTITWFLTINHRSHTNHVQDSHPLLKDHLLASPSFISRRRSESEETRPATFIERKYVKGIYEKGTTCISFGDSIAYNAILYPDVWLLSEFLLLRFPPLFSSRASYAQDVHIAGRCSRSWSRRRFLFAIHDGKSTGKFNVSQKSFTSTTEIVKWITQDNKS